jgi:hypothetical protein
MNTAIVGLVGVIVGAVLTTVLNFYLQRAADIRRWQREEQRQQQLWEREDRTRFQEERLRVYRDFIVAAKRARDLKEFNEDNMSNMVGEIELISGTSNVVWPAVNLRYLSEDVWLAGHRRTPPQEEDLVIDKWEREYAKFNRAAQAELGIPRIPYQLTEKADGAEPESTPEASEEGAHRPWWRRVFGQ